MRVLFIVRDLGGAEPLGLMYVSAMLRQHGHETKFLPTRGIDLMGEVCAFAPQVIGYGICTGQHRYYLALNRWLKKQHRFLAIFGGPHATFFPEMIEEDSVDIVCRGEGEYPTLDLCDRLASGRDIADIPNLWVKQDGRITRNPVRPLIANLDDLPFPDREARYAADPEQRKFGAKSFLTSRGCPYRCSYCFNASMEQLYGAAWGQRRLRSPENVLREIESVAATSTLRFVQFRCSMFPYEIPWLDEFADSYRRRIGLPFYCHVRANHMSEEVVALLARAGCRSVNMGIECSDEHYRAEVLHRHISNQVIREACERLHRHGIAILADNMLGLPGRTLDDDIETLRFNIECGIDYPLAMLLQPYPGTGIEQYAREHGFFDGDYDAIDYNYYFRSPLRFSDAREKRQIENLHKFFAIAAEVPWALPLVRRLIRLPPNLVFNSIFRCWYAFCYHRRIMPHRLRWKDVAETLKVLFGIYRREALHGGDEEGRAVDVGAPCAHRGDGGGAVPVRLSETGKPATKAGTRQSNDGAEIHRGD